MRAIDADELKDHIKIFNIGCGCSEDYQKSFLNAIDEQPTIEPERKPGYWIEHKRAEEVEGLLISNYECSCCHNWERKDSDYCPNCGIPMTNKD